MGSRELHKHTDYDQGYRKERGREPAQPLARLSRRQRYKDKSPREQESKHPLTYAEGPGETPGRHPSTPRGPVPCWPRAHRDSPPKPRSAKSRRKVGEKQTKTPLTQISTPKKNPVEKTGKTRKHARKTRKSGEIRYSWPPTGPSHQDRDRPISAPSLSPRSRDTAPGALGERCHHVASPAGAQATTPRNRPPPPGRNATEPAKFEASRKTFPGWSKKQSTYRPCVERF